MRLPALTLRERFIFMVFVVVCTVYGVYNFLYRPLTNQAQELEERIQYVHKKFNEQTKMVYKEKSISPVIREALERLVQKSSNEEVLSGILTEIESAARGMKVRVNEMKPQGVSKTDDFNQFTVGLTLEGNFAELLAFVHLLQSPQHELGIVQLQLDKNPADPKTLLSKLIVMRTLIRPVQK